MITNLSEATVPDMGPSPLLQALPPSMGAALDLDYSERPLLRAFTFHGKKNLTNSGSAPTAPKPQAYASLYYSEELVRLRTTLYSSISMLDFCFFNSEPVLCLQNGSPALSWN